MSSEDLENLHNIWITFLNTKNTKEGESWLDTFLARYLTLFCCNEISPNHDFSFQYKYSANVLVHQLLTDVFQLCETVEKESSSPESENEISSEYFQKYLLEGRGWKILWTLDKIGVRHLMHLKELVVVLISQIPLLLTLPVHPSVIPESLERKPKHLDLSSCFYVPNRQSNVPKNVDLRKPEIYLPFKRNFQGRKRVRKKRIKPDVKSSSSSSEEQDVIFESCYIPASQLKSLLKVKTGANNDHSSSDSKESLQENAVPDTSLISDSNDFHSYSVSVVDYIAFNLNVFQECVLLDAKFKDIKAFTSPPVLEFSFRLLKEIHTDKYKFTGWPEDDVEDLKNRLLELLFLSSTVSRISFGYNESPSTNEIISTLFLISEGVMSLPPRTSLKSKNILFLSNILKGCLMVVHNVIETCNEDYAKVICIIRTFSDTGGNLSCRIFSLLERQISTESENELKIIIPLVKDIITTLKILRTSVTYSSNDMCDIKDYIHHHNDIFGPPVSHSIINKDPMCSIAAVSCLLLKLFSVSLCPKTSNEILRHLKMSGICCCVNPSFILKSLFDGFASRDPETQKLILVILSKHLFPQLGLVFMCQRRCSYCSKYLNTSDYLTLDAAPDCYAPENRKKILNSDSEMADSFELIFSIYNDLLNLIDEETLENISKHLIEIFSICVSELKAQIFIRVIFPQFLHLNINPDKPLCSLLSIKIKCFLSILPHVLSDCSIYSVFVRYKGIPVMFTFLENSEFRELALGVIKILISSEYEYKNDISLGNLELSSYPALRTFCTFLFSQSEVFFQKLNLVLRLSCTFPELSEDHSELLELTDKSTLTVLQELPENVIFMYDMWNCFKELVLTSKLETSNVFFSEVLASGYNLMILLLKNLTSFLRIKIIVENEKVEMILLLIQSLISVLVNVKKEAQHKQSVLDIVRHNLKIHVPKCVKYQRMLFCLILKCCFWHSSATTPVRQLSESIHSEKENLDSISSSDKDESDMHMSGESYAADTEGSSSNLSVVKLKEGFPCENFIEHAEFAKMLCELVADLQTESSSEWISTALYFMHKLNKLCQDCSINKSILCEHEIPPLLLDIFSKSLIMNQRIVQDFQSATMDLFVTLTVSAMRVKYIKNIFDFFKTPEAPVDILLKSLNKMVDQMIHHPVWYITFPCIQKSTTSYLRVKKRLRTTYNACKQYNFVQNVISAWTSAALFFPLTEDTKWNAVNKGFSLAFWLKLNFSSDNCERACHSVNNSLEAAKHESLPANSFQKRQMLHILSLGSDQFLIEFWCGNNSADLIIRITSYINGVITCLSEGTCTLLFQYNTWHHVAIAYSEETEKSIYTSKFQVILDGCKEKICTLKYKRTGIKSLNKCHLLVGNSFPVCTKSTTMSYSLASFCLFKDNVFTKEVLYYLANWGPDVNGITNCAVEKPSKLIMKSKHFQTLSSLSNLDVITSNKIPSLEPLQNSVLCSFAAENPNIYLVYPTAPRGFFPLHFPIRGKSRLSSFEDWPYQKQPLEFSNLSLAVLHSYQYCGFEYAVQNAGGIRLFLFLFANILEQFPSEENLSSALNIVLKLLNKSMAFVEDFTRIKGFELLIQMITSSKCCISSDFLQVFIQNCMIYVFPEKQTYLNKRLPEVENLTIIRNTSIFSLMLKSLAFASQSPPSVTTGLFSVLDLLLNPKHSKLSINVEQLISVHTLSTLMWLLKRNYILFDHNYLPAAVIKMVPIIIENLLIYKFDVKVLKSIICMLLLLHNASTTYVCHSPSSFFFLTPRDKSTDFASVKLFNVSDDEEDVVVDANKLLLLPKIHRTSSFSGIFTSKEERKFHKSKSLEHLTCGNLSGNKHFDGNIPSSDVIDKTQSFKQGDIESKFMTDFNHNKSVELTNGLLKLIYSFITSKNVSQSQATLEVIKPEIFIVLAYTENSEICTSVIKVINAFLKTASEEKRNEFLSMKGFHLLANQLYQSPANPDIIDACVSIIFDCPLSTSNIYALFENITVSSFKILSWVPVLALLPNTYSNEILCEKIITVLNKFLHLGTVVIMELLENGLIVCLINLLLKFCLSTEFEPGEELFEKYPTVKKVHNLLKFMSQDLCSSRSSKGFTSFVEILQIFSAWERMCEDKYGPESPCVTCLRNCQCIMFEIVVEFSELYNLQRQEYKKINDETSLWELVVELQGTFGTFSSMTLPQSALLPSTHSHVHNAVEADELDNPLPPEAERVNEVPINDIIDRLLCLIEAAADFFFFKDHRVKIGFAEKEFFKIFTIFIIESITTTLDKNFKLMKSKNSAILFALRDTLKKQLGRILLSSVAPSQDFYIKACITEVLSAHPFAAKILQLVIYSIVKIGTFVCFIYDLQTEPILKLQKQSQLLFVILKQLLENTNYFSVLHNKEAMEKVKISWYNLWNEDRCKWLSICNKRNEKTFEKMEFLAQDVSTMALYVTQQVFEVQNMERKILIEELKTKYYEEACERMTWLELCEQMTHERAIWHMKDYYPFSWEIDPTEGPARVRRRLRRCHIHMHPRFFQQDHADALTALKKGSPFVNILLPQNDYPDSAVVFHRLFRDEQIKFTCPCKIVTAFEEIAVEILIGAYCIHIIGENISSQNTKSPISESWAFESIKEIVPCRHELLNNAFEMFLTNGLTYMIAFNSEKDFNIIWKQLQSEGLPCEANKDPLVITQLWRDGSITNYEYLMDLNKLAGRTFNDLMQYPVFPFVLANYKSFFLDLSDLRNFRNLVKPIAVQLEKKEQHYRNTYQMLSEQAEFDLSLPYIGPYHYGSHYSNSGTVLHYLIRILPYTYGFLAYQDRNFDCPDRTFHNLATSWELVTEKSSSDVKELTPEFFFLPEFLSNKNGFDFGITQNGIRVNDVILPPWCKQNARLFILIHRQALESEVVTNNLHNWIDLIFGYKQTGEAAINAVNVFHPSTYYGMDRNKYSDPVKRDAFRTMIRTLGNTPQQLFFSPHPMVSLSLSGLDLADENMDKIEVIDTVQGLRWGNYVGSPATGIPCLVWCRKQSIILGSFLPLLTNYVFGLGENVCLLLNHKKDMGSGISRATYIMSAALVSWNHWDGIVRIKLCRDQPSLPLLRGSSIDSIRLCASVPDCKHLFVGHSSGIINAYTLELNAVELAVREEQSRIQLNGHSDAVTSIYICKAFSIVASASLDKTVIIWDLNRLCYVRSLSNFEGAVTLVCVSDTLGDVASVCNIENNVGSILKVHTINGDIVGTVQILETVTAVCYSTAPEGLSVNVIATGLSNGVIRLWSSWDLKLVRVIVCDRFTLPIRCLSFSADNQHLYASNEDGTVTVWEKPSRGLTSVPRLLVFT